MESRNEVKVIDQAARALVETGGLNLKAAKNVALNAAVGELDMRVQGYAEDVPTQMGVLVLCQALAFRRLLLSKNIKDRGRRHKLAKLAAADFMAKLMQYGTPPEEGGVKL